MSFDELRDIFLDISEDPEIQLNSETALKSINNWDSLHLINLAIALEKKFKVKLSAVEITSIHKISDILELLESKGISVTMPA